MIGGASGGFFGCSDPALVGKTCRRDTHLPALAGDGCGTGRSRMSGSPSGVSFWGNWTSRADSTGKRPLPTAPSPRQKKGRLRRKDQTRKGYEVDGGGKRPRCSSGSSTCQCVPA